MEHHTYAKKRPKKWSIEEKHLLVTKRIAAEDLFSKHSTKLFEPWRKFKDIAKIGNYSEHALRKQWLNMVQHYRIQKSNLQITQLSKQCIELLDEEWEFFSEIHAYMTQRTTDLHSYALKESNIDICRPNVENSLLKDNAVDLRLEALQNSFDNLETCNLEDNTCWYALNPLKKNTVGFSQSKLIMGRVSPGDSYADTDSFALEVSDMSEMELLPCSPLETTKTTEWRTDFHLTTSSEANVLPLPPKRNRKDLSEKEKYYRHRRRYDHRMELRLGELCTVAGQLLEHLVPNFNVAPLLQNICNSVNYNCNSSCDEDETGDEDVTAIRTKRNS